MKRFDKIRRAFRACLNLFNVRLVNVHTLASLRGLEEGLIRLKKFEADGDENGSNFKLYFEQEPAAALYVAHAFISLVQGCANYREVQFTPRAGFRAQLGFDYVTVTVQKQIGRTPHQLRQEAEQRYAQLQIAAIQAAQPFAAAVEWLGPENIENGVCDTDKVMMGARQITVGDMRRVAALMKHPDLNPAVRVFTPDTENVLIDQATAIHRVLAMMCRELRERGACKHPHIHIEHLHLIGAHLNTMMRAAIGDKAPEYEAK